MKPSLKKPGDFTMAEGHGHPLVQIIEAFFVLNKIFLKKIIFTIEHIKKTIIFLKRKKKINK